VVFVFRSVFVQLNGKAAAWVEGNSMLFAVLCKKMPLPEMATAFFRICLHESVSGEETLTGPGPP
jgi:hypothetical protein